MISFEETLMIALSNCRNGSNLECEYQKVLKAHQIELEKVIKEIS